MAGPRLSEDELIARYFAPLAGAKAGELAARFDIVLGVTPEA